MHEERFNKGSNEMVLTETVMTGKMTVDINGSNWGDLDTDIDCENDTEIFIFESNDGLEIKHEDLDVMVETLFCLYGR